MRDGCPFCDYEGPSAVRWVRPGVYVIEPVDPVAEGHVLVVPREHVEDFVATPAVTAAVAMTAAEYAHVLGGDWNLITSAGEAATQTVRHLHVHLVPRKPGDGLLLPWSIKEGRRYKGVMLP